MTIDKATLDHLDQLSRRGDPGRVPYYQALIAAGDPYAKLALGVVRQDTMAGRVAFSYALEVSKRCCHQIKPKGWIELSVALMQADLASRKNPANFEPGKPSLTWRTIRDYHRAAFHQVADLPPEAWTAWIPLLIVGEAHGEALWHRMLNEGFIHVGVETVELVLAREAGILRDLHHSVVPVVRTAPPGVTHIRPRDPAYERCMVWLASQQMQSRPGGAWREDGVVLSRLSGIEPERAVSPIPGDSIRAIAEPEPWRPAAGIRHLAS